MGARGAEGEDAETGQGGFGMTEVFPVLAGDGGDGVEHDGGGDGELDDEAGQAEEATSGSSQGGGPGVEAFGLDCDFSGAVSRRAMWRHCSRALLTAVPMDSWARSGRRRMRDSSGIPAFAAMVMRRDLLSRRDLA